MQQISMTIGRNGGRAGASTAQKIDGFVISISVVFKVSHFISVLGYEKKIKTFGFKLG